jgi:type II secretory pathway pseudopilin PulG
MMVLIEMRKPRPFTLIELLITMSVLLLLISLVQPSLSKVINHAIELESSQDLRVLHQGTLFYSEENSSLLPMKYLKTSKGWTSLWINTVSNYLEHGRENPAFQNRATYYHAGRKKY